MSTIRHDSALDDTVRTSGSKGPFGERTAGDETLDDGRATVSQSATQPPLGTRDPAKADAATIPDRPGGLEATAVGPGSVVAGRYTVRRLLGTGALGRVYQARDGVLGIEVALKILHGEAVRRTGARERLARELRLGRLVSHPSVVRLHDVGADESGRPFITMDLLEGETLQVQLRRRTTLSAREIKALACDLSAALDALHQQGIVHGDVKPANVLLLADGRAVLMDFGSARRLGDTEAADSPAGSPDYMAPEVLAGQPPTAASDLYSLGTLLYEAAVGAPQLAGHGGAVTASLRQRESGPDPRRQRPDLPPDMTALIRQLVARLPRERPASARELSRALLAGDTSSLLAPGRRRRMRRMATVAAAVAAVALPLGIGLDSVLRGAGRPRVIAVAPFASQPADWQGRALARLVTRELERMRPLRTIATADVERAWIDHGALGARAPERLAAVLFADAVVTGQLDERAQGFEVHASWYGRRGKQGVLGAAPTGSIRVLARGLARAMTAEANLDGERAQTVTEAARARRLGLGPERAAWHYDRALEASLADPPDVELCRIESERSVAAGGGSRALGLGSGCRLDAPVEALLVRAERVLSAETPRATLLLVRARRADRPLERSRLLREARQLDPEEDLERDALLLGALVHLGRDEEALALARELFDRQPALGAGRQAVELLHRVRGLEEARRLAATWVARAPESSTAHAVAGALALEAGDPAGAEQAFRALMALDGPGPLGLGGLARALAAAGRADDGRAEAERLLLGDPASRGLGHALLAEVAALQGNLDVARRELGEATESAGGLVAEQAADALIELELYEGRTEAARGVAASALARASGRRRIELEHLAHPSPRDLRGVGNDPVVRARVLRRGGAPERCVALRAAIGVAAAELSPADWLAVGRCEIVAGDPAAAQRALSRAVGALSQSFDGVSPVLARLERGRLATRTGHRDRAIADLEAVVRGWGDAERPRPEVALARADLQALRRATDLPPTPRP